MIRRHPDLHWLTEYSAGSLPSSYALCVKTHLEYCSDCKIRCAQLLRVGASLFSTDPGASAEQNSLDEIWHKIDPPLSVPADSQGAVVSGNQLDSVHYPEDFPAIIRKLVPSGTDALHWTWLGPRLSVATLDARGDTSTIALHKLSPGGRVANHDHRGREITVVLSGSFSDQHGQYQPGDFLLREPGDEHQPTASENQECVCLSVSDAPVKFTGLFTRLLNPLLAFQFTR